MKTTPDNTLDMSLLSDQLTRVVDRRATQDTINWQIFGLFGTGAATLGFWATTNDKFGDGSIATLGTLVGLVWFLVQQRSLLGIVVCEHAARALEEKLGVVEFAPGNLQKTDHSFYSKYPERKKIVSFFSFPYIPARFVMSAVSFATAVSWPILWIKNIC